MHSLIDITSIESARKTIAHVSAAECGRLAVIVLLSNQGLTRIWAGRPRGERDQMGDGQFIKEPPSDEAESILEEVQNLLERRSWGDREKAHKLLRFFAAILPDYESSRPQGGGD